MKYVGRWANGSGRMEWAGRPVDSIELAKAQVTLLGWTDVDVIEVFVDAHGREEAEGSTVATGVRGQGWKDSEAQS